MDTKQVQSRLKMLRLCSSKKSLSPTYRSVEIGPGYVRAYAPYGLLEVSQDLGLNSVIHVDATALLAAINGVPGSEIKFRETSTALMVEGGNTKVRVAKADLDNFPRILVPEELPDKPEELNKALTLGSTSLGNVDGMQVLVIHHDKILATDNISISCYQMEELLTNDRFFLTTEAADLLIALSKEEGTFGFFNRSLYFSNDIYTCLIKHGTFLEHDLSDTIQKYTKGEYITIPEELEKTLKLAMSLSSSRVQSTVTLSVTKGVLTVSADQTAAGVKAEFAVEYEKDGEIVVSTPILIRGLSVADRMNLSYMDGGVLILKGGQVTYLISAKG